MNYKAYQEGYKQGRYDERMKWMYEERTEETPLEKRYRETLKEIETELRCNADLKECVRNIGRLVEKVLYAELLNSCSACNGSGQVKMLRGIVPCPVCRQSLETQND